MLSDHDAAAIVAEARTWRGTPYRNRGRIKGVEADCLFVEEVMRVVLGYTGRHSGYSMMPRDRQIEAVLDADMNLIVNAGRRPIAFSHMRQGRLALFNGADKNEPQHVGIIAIHPTIPEARTLIHAYGGHNAKGRVIENTICTAQTFRRGGEVRSLLGDLWAVYEARG